MTMYTEDVNYRMHTVFLILAVVSIALTFALHSALPTYPRVIAPATLMFYAILFWLFDAFLWKVPVIRLLNSGIPNLAGIWEGELARSVEGKEQHFHVKLVIKQTWSKIDLSLLTTEARSRNTLAGLQLVDPNAIMLTWIYEIEGTNARSVSEWGKGIIELTLHRKTNTASMTGASFSGSFIASGLADPLNVEFKKRAFRFWNPEPI